jgi:hypothetical protein
MLQISAELSYEMTNNLEILAIFLGFMGSLVICYVAHLTGMLRRQPEAKVPPFWQPRSSLIKTDRSHCIILLPACERQVLRPPFLFGVAPVYGLR